MCVFLPLGKNIIRVFLAWKVQRWHDVTLISVLKVVEEAICDKGQRASCRESGGGDGRQDMRCVWERRGGPLASDAKRPPLPQPPLDERQCVPCRRKKAMSADSKQPNGSSSRPPVKLVACNRLRTTSTSAPAAMRNTKQSQKTEIHGKNNTKTKTK